MSLSCREDFVFPGTPYAIQLEFMRKAYAAMTTGGLCILESPTGTGKSLSMICSCLAWLRDCRYGLIVERFLRHNQGDSTESQPNWVATSLRNQAEVDSRELISTWEQQRIQLMAHRSRICSEQPDGAFMPKMSRKRATPGADNVKEECEGLDLLEDTQPKVIASESECSLTRRMRIYICSRTHSQISQLIKEMKRCDLAKNFNIVALGSRANMCINTSVDKRAPVSVINDKCRHLVDTNKCSHKVPSLDLAHLISAAPLDLEEICQYATTRVPGCPYYSAKDASLSADIVFVPYPSLIHEPTRRALGLTLDDNVVVFDEAHNILEAINSTRSSTLQLSEIECVRVVIKSYLDTYRERLSPRNLVLVKQVAHLAASFARISQSDTSVMFSVEDFLVRSGTSELNIPSISLFLRDGQFCRKLRGHAERATLEKPGSIYNLSAFVSRLHESEPSDRIFSDTRGEEPSLVYASIDAETEMARILTQARAVLLVGGTMSPVDEFRLVADLAESRLEVARFSNVIGKDRLYARIVKGDSGEHESMFTQQTRDQPEYIATLCNLLNSVLRAMDQGGLVLFVPSFKYLAQLAGRIGRECEACGVTALIDSGNGSSTEIFQRYSSRIKAGDRCVLATVVGGSLSEGIDFTDGLCRALIVVGLPYGNIADPVLKERMKYFDEKHVSHPDCPDGRKYYDIRCMKAVNQCLGRAIRHSADWASIFLLDSRYSNERISKMLPSWVMRNLVVAQSIEHATDGLGSFFMSHSVVAG